MDMAGVAASSVEKEGKAIADGVYYCEYVTKRSENEVTVVAYDVRRDGVFLFDGSASGQVPHSGRMLQRWTFRSLQLCVGKLGSGYCSRSHMRPADYLAFFNNSGFPGL